MSSDKLRTLDILIALIAMEASFSALHNHWRTLHAHLLRIAEKLLCLQPGDGSQALRMTNSLVQITGRAEVADDNLSLPENPYRDEDVVRFHHKSFIDYMLDPSRSLENYVDSKEMNTRLALACIVTMQTFSLQPTSRLAFCTFPLSVTHNILIFHA